MYYIWRKFDVPYLFSGVRFASLRLFFVVSYLRIEEGYPKYGRELLRVVV